MTDPPHSSERILAALRERAKELSCLYAVEEVLHRDDEPVESLLRQALALMPAGWQFPEICQLKLVFDGVVIRTGEFEETPWMQRADVTVHQRVVGTLYVYYEEQRPLCDVGPFLREEERLLGALADRLGTFLQLRKPELAGLKEAEAGESLPGRRGEWRGAVHLLRKTDHTLYVRIARKMMNQLSASGVEEALRAMARTGDQEGAEDVLEGNWPHQKRRVDDGFYLTDEPFEIAARYLSDEEILGRIERWIFEDRCNSLVKTLADQQSTLGEIGEAIRRYRVMVPANAELSRALVSGMRVSLIRRFLTEQLEFITVAKEHIAVSDFLALLDRMILPAGSHGKLGGKSAGLFLAEQVLRKALKSVELATHFRTPRSWYVASDGILDFMEYNNLEEIIEHKYKEIDQVRREYPYLVQLFKNAEFPPELVQGLSMALDDFGDQPIIVRSSSLLEDRLGTAFSGKYKSLFLANQGSKRKRLEALMDAVAEIYASTFGPDPIEYRRERKLLDFNEEMGILLQEVVGKRVGRYFFPAFAGVAFSNNEFRWSPRIRRDDGLLRIVPGLGTRAVDRVPDDYPVLIAPGQPHLRANVSVEDVMRYSPHKLDVINLETESFETVDLRDLLRETGCDYPAFARVFSAVREGHLSKPSGILCDTPPEDLAVTFQGLTDDSSFVQQMAAILRLLQESLGSPVDLEFASDGSDVYLLQCRPQSHTIDSIPTPIPRDLPPDEVLFSANRYVSNGLVPDITHVVYVDPAGYGAIEQLSDLVAMGRAIGLLNKMLPKRQFILMGPGRWGSRGDIKLGVSVTYSDINNTAVLIEIARKKGNYVPDLSFGTHFFQDLVEASIRYLPLYPDDPGVHFNEGFLSEAPNILPDVLPDYAHLAPTLRVIDVTRARKGQVLRLAMNADEDAALAYFGSASAARTDRRTERPASPARVAEDHWRWRVEMAERLAAGIDANRFGVKAIYLFGSAKNGTASAASDLDLIFHVDGGPGRLETLREWLDGWSAALAELNYLRTGVKVPRIIDPYFVTDPEVTAHTGIAAKIGAVTDPAKPLPLGRRAD